MIISGCATRPWQTAAKRNAHGSYIVPLQLGLRSSDLNSQHVNSKLPIPSERIERSILLIRGQKVMLDADLAELYGVPTKALNQAVKRNSERFPPDFMFRLTREEKDEAVTNCDHLRKLRFSSVLPSAFTEHGALMLASVLNSSRAVEMSVFVVRAFVKLRQMLASNRDLARRLNEMEKKYDTQFRVVFDAIRELMKMPERPRRKIGFGPGGQS
jgi:ORF6N domain